MKTSCIFLYESKNVFIMGTCTFILHLFEFVNDYFIVLHSEQHMTFLFVFEQFIFNSYFMFFCCFTKHDCDSCNLTVLTCVFFIRFIHQLCSYYLIFICVMSKIFFVAIFFFYEELSKQYKPHLSKLALKINKQYFNNANNTTNYSILYLLYCFLYFMILLRTLFLIIGHFKPSW